ncbi:MAG: hypothetical protein V1837_05475 [Candidatus Woesearchaeota archaeon]
MRCIFLLLVFVCLAGIVSADQYDVMMYYGKVASTKCYPNGQAVLPFTQIKGDVPLPGFIKDVAIKAGPDTYLWIAGSYYTTDFEKTNISKHSQNTLFVSKEYTFIENKNYSVVFSGIFAELIPIYEFVSLLKFTVNCPGYKHICAPLNLTIDNCTTDRNFFRVDFHGLGSKEFSDVNVSTDVVFTLNPEDDEKNVGKLALPFTREFFALGNDRYVLRIPVEDLPAVASVSVHVTGCIDELYATKDSHKCVNIKEKALPLVSNETLNYECNPVAQEAKRDICTQVIAIPEEKLKPVSEPSLSILVFDLAKRIVHFASHLGR